MKENVAVLRAGSGWIVLFVDTHDTPDKLLSWTIGGGYMEIATKALEHLNTMPRLAAEIVLYEYCKREDKSYRNYQLVCNSQLNLFMKACPVIN